MLNQILFYIAVFLLFSGESCKTTTMNPINLPLTPFPENGLLLYEHIGEGTHDISGNTRYLILSDGKYYLQRNGSEAGEGNGNYWSAPLPEQPTQELSSSQLQEIQQAIGSIADLKSYYRHADLAGISHPSFKGYTFHHQGHTRSIVVEADAGPQALEDFRMKVNSILRQ